MARNENAPFPRGGTWYGGSTIDATDLGGVHLEGKMYEFEDIDYNTADAGAAKTYRSGRSVKCMVVRNTSGSAILPKQLVTFEADGKELLGRVDGKCDVDYERAYPADEFLPSAGVPNNDLFYIVVEGPAMFLTPLEGNALNVFNVGQHVAALTAATSGATTAGRIQPITAAATTNSFNQIANRIGVALSARTTANTNADILIDVTKM